MKRTKEGGKGDGKGEGEGKRLEGREEGRRCGGGKDGGRGVGEEWGKREGLERRGREKSDWFPAFVPVLGEEKKLHRVSCPKTTRQFTSGRKRRRKLSSASLFVGASR